MLWIMDGPNFAKQVTLPPNDTSRSAAWKIEGAGFFDLGTDKHSDLVWFKGDGSLKLWRILRDPTTGVLSYAEVPFVPGRETDNRWKLVGVGEFNFGVAEYPDLLWRDPNTGALRVWIMNGTTRTQILTTNPDGRGDLGWKPIAK
jgi:hypothetical protein